MPVVFSEVRKVKGTWHFTATQDLEVELQARFAIYIGDDLVFDGAAFVYPYQVSEREAIPGGWRFKIRSKEPFPLGDVISFGAVNTEEIVTQTLSVGSQFSVDGSTNLFGELLAEGGIRITTGMPSGVVPVGQMKVGTDGTDLYIRIGSSNYKLTKVAV